MDYYNRYKKYKKKYMALKEMMGGYAKIVDPTG